MKEIYNFKALLLDLDGTLINSEKAFYESFKDVLKNEYSIDITMEEYKKYELEQNAMLLNVLLDKKLIFGDNITNIIMQKIYDYYETKFLEVISEKEVKYNFELLKRIKNEDIILALVTTSRRHYINLLLEKLNLYELFDLIIAREDVKNLKPNSEAYLKTLKLLSLEASNCLAIEDSKRGIDSAINAGITTIKVENFTSIKFSYKNAIEMNSTTTFFEDFLSFKAKQRQRK